jgi:hypothetical protein
MKGASPTAAKFALTSQKEGGGKTRCSKKKIILQNAFIRIQFLDEFKYFCPYLKQMLHSDLNPHHLRRNPRM